jgi:ribonuclease HII
MFRPSTKPASGGPERARWRHAGHTPRRNAGLAAYENVLARAGFSPVAGIDEAGRGACAGPLVVAAVVLDSATIRRLPGLADSKSLSPDEREDVYAVIVRRALDWHVLAIPPQEVDALGLHVCNVEGMRRALAGLRRRPGYVLTDGFPVRGLGAPALAVWKGDQITASVAAASVVAKVTRDRMMVALDECYPAYGFARHKGYSTPEHMTALYAYGPCPEHRYSYANVIEANRRWATGWRAGADLTDSAGLVEGGAAPGDARREPCAPARADDTAIGDSGDALADGAAIGDFEGALADAAVTGGAGAGRPVSRVDSGPATADGRGPGDAWTDLWRAGVTAPGADETEVTWANTPAGGD